MTVKHISEVLNEVIVEREIRSKHNIPEHVPIVDVERVNGNELRFFCPYCNDHHRHGGGPEKGSGDGFRGSHCIFVRGSYFIREVDCLGSF